MKLYDVIKGVKCDRESVDNCDIEGIAIDSRKVNNGDLFFAIKGYNCDGAIYAKQAIQNGAKYVISEHLIQDVPCIVVENIRETLSICSANFFNHPEKSLKIIAVVGTNGKSTSAYFTYCILRYNGYKVGLIGTNRVEYNDKKIITDMTTPDPIDLYRYFRMMVDSGIEYVVMEVSAHAIYLDKMYGIKCEIGLFTNFSQDHLDFFKEMNIYKRVKMSFFNQRYLKVGIVNSDDKVGQEILSKTSIPTFTYGLDSPSDVFAIDIEYCIDGTRFVINMLDEISHFATSIVGKYNVYNILGASLVARLMGIPMYGIRDAVEKLKPLDGRYNIIKSKSADIVIDFAHTPYALENLLIETRKIRNGEIYVVFGAGGNRDKAKRPIMGEIATRLADHVILTSDNSRDEKTSDIVEDIIGNCDRDKITIIEDRYDAIKYAYEMATAKDVILVVGKGAEEYQDNGNGKIYYSDRMAILDIINE